MGAGARCERTQGIEVKDSGEGEHAAAADAGLCEVALHIDARAEGFAEFFMGVDAADGDAVGAGELSDETIEGGELGGGGGLDLEIAETHDAEVVFVLVFDVGTGEVRGATFPDAAGRIDDVVVADVGPLIADVVGAVLFQLGHDGSLGCEASGYEGIVMNGDAGDAAHGTGAIEEGDGASPC